MKKIKVLYVEDEPFLGKIVKESLESRDFLVHMVSDGGMVVHIFEQYEPDICLLDVMLPNKDGFTIGKEIRQKKPEMPIIFLTAKTQTQDLLKGFESGGNDYIRKPFSMEELIVRINNLLNLMNSIQKDTTKNDRIPIGRYTFFPLKYELHFEKDIRKLSNREVQLLNILLKHQNFTVERKMILKKVWGDDSFFNSRNLDVYITKLRDYFKHDPNVKIITLKGVGYHFSVE
ncbi:MAG: response regulator transcription factor [Bacteroidetes bacterium]|nr:response regulator transcription factor [Bacteroidota bacterium]